VTPERWKRIEELYHSALAREGGQRAAYLAEACAGDEELRREVESLLSNAEESGGFLEGQALEAAPRRYVSAVVPDLTGRKLGRYEVMARLGGGGMGEFYRARDTRLKREVALKVLPPESVADPDRRRRFEHEARAASALNHPNIITTYDIDQAEGIHFIAMECVPGRTLGELIGRKGLPVAEALKYAVQMADALAAAHDAGIVHRDLKPVVRGASSTLPYCPSPSAWKRTRRYPAAETGGKRMPPDANGHGSERNLRPTLFRDPRTDRPLDVARSCRQVRGGSPDPQPVCVSAFPRTP